MTFIRSLRSVSQGYVQDRCDPLYVEEHVSCSLRLESADCENSVEIANDWPAVISLCCAVKPTAISSQATVTRIENGRTIGVLPLYHNTKVDLRSAIQNAHLCCQKVNLTFEGTGTFQLNDRVERFSGSNLNERFELSMKSDCLFEKSFNTVAHNIVEKSSCRLGQAPVLEPNGLHVAFYPYGGFYKYGAHPRQMEACACRVVHDGAQLAVRIVSASDLASGGIPAGVSVVNGQKIAGIEGDTRSLYDDLKTGQCSIQVKNSATKTKATYKSQSVDHVSGTNLLCVHFVKE